MTDDERATLAEYDRIIAEARKVMKLRRSLCARIRVRRPAKP